MRLRATIPLILLPQSWWRGYCFPISTGVQRKARSMLARAVAFNLLMLLSAQAANATTTVIFDTSTGIVPFSADGPVSNSTTIAGNSFPPAVLISTPSPCPCRRTLRRTASQFRSIFMRIAARAIRTACLAYNRNRAAARQYRELCVAGDLDSRHQFRAWRPGQHRAPVIHLLGSGRVHNIERQVTG